MMGLVRGGSPARAAVPLSLVLFLPLLAAALLLLGGNPTSSAGMAVAIIAMPIIVLIIKTFIPATLLGLCGITLEVLIGRVSWLWLLPVLGIAGAYYSYVIPDHLAFHQAQRAGVAHNAALALPFDRTRQGIEFSEAGFPREDEADPGLGRSLLMDYGLPVVWNRQNGAALRLIDSPLCEELKTAYPGINIGFLSGSLSLHSARSGGAPGHGKHDARFCILSLPEPAPDTAVRLGAAGAQLMVTPVFQLPTLRLHAPGDTAGLEVARTTPTRTALPLNPFHLDGGNMGRRAHTRGDFLPGIVQVLGLAPADRQASDTAVIRPMVQAAVARETGRQLTLLDSAIAGAVLLSLIPEAERTPDARLLRLNPAALAARAAPAMAALHDQQTGRDLRQRLEQPRQRVLETGLYALPDAEFAKVEPQIRALMAQNGYAPALGTLRERLKYWPEPVPGIGSQPGRRP